MTGYASCNVSLLPIRKEPSHRAEQISQLLFGEKAIIQDEKANDWMLIQCLWDGYEGWCKGSQLSRISRQLFSKETPLIAANSEGKLWCEDGGLWIPAGASLRRGTFNFKDDRACFKGKRIAVDKMVLSGENVCDAALEYLMAPYQWGGRTIAGIDCSGLSQMAYLFCNKRMKRDASQQAEEGEIVDFLQHANAGDLAFFDNAEGKINHVGILLSSTSIIHATDSAGCVVIDTIDQGGIISKTLRKRTHQLRFVKRYF